MSTSQVLDRAFSLYRRNFLLFAGIAALPPAMVLVGQLLVMGGTALASRLSGAMQSFAVLVPGVVLFVFLYLLGSSLATGATVHAVSCVHLGSPVSIAASYRAVLPLLWRMLGIMILVGLMAGGAFAIGYAFVLIPLALISAGTGGTGLLLPIIGGFVGFAAMAAALVWSIRIYCRYSLAVPACVVEHLPVMLSLRRSRFLSIGSLGRIFLAFFLLLILMAALGLVLSIPDYIELIVRSEKPTLPFQIWDLISGFLSGTLSGPVGTIAIALIYYDQRVRKEAFDLHLMMEAIAQPAPTASAAYPSAG